MLSEKAAGAVSVCICVEVKVKGQREGQNLAFVVELVSILLPGQPSIILDISFN